MSGWFKRMTDKIVNTSGIEREIKNAGDKAGSQIADELKDFGNKVNENVNEAGKQMNKEINDGFKSLATFGKIIAVGVGITAVATVVIAVQSFR